MTDFTVVSTASLKRLLDAVQPVIAIVQDYDEQFPYAQLEGDDEKCTELVQAEREVRKAAAL